MEDRKLTDYIDDLHKSKSKRMKRREKREALKKTIKQQRFMKNIIIFLFLLTIVFTIASFAVFIFTGGNEPSSLISGFFDFVKWEAGGLSLIKVAECVGRDSPSKKKSKLGEVMDDGADILDNTAELFRDTNDILHGNNREELVDEETDSDENN